MIETKINIFRTNLEINDLIYNKMSKIDGILIDSIIIKTDSYLFDDIQLINKLCENFEFIINENWITQKKFNVKYLKAYINIYIEYNSLAHRNYIINNFINE